MWREHLHAATVTGRVAGARRAVELGYRIEPDDGPSGRLGQWRIAGVPVEAEEVFSKRAAEVDGRGRGASASTSYRARSVAARTTRTAKRFTPVSDLMARWQAELAEIGLTPDVIGRDVDAATRNDPGRPRELPAALSVDELRALRDEVFAPRRPSGRPEGVRPPRRGRRGRAPHLRQRPGRARPGGRRVAVGSRRCPTRRWWREPGSASTPPASVIAVEAAIASTFLNGVDATDAPAVPQDTTEAVIARKEAELGGSLTDGQVAAVRAITTSGRARGAGRRRGGRGQDHRAGLSSVTPSRPPGTG